MNEDHEPEPDLDEPITRWELTSCICGGLLYRAARRSAWPVPNGWQHVRDPDQQRPS